MLGTTICLSSSLLLWQRSKLPTYSGAKASFETNQILRGLTSTEAAYYLKLTSRQIFCVSLFTLFDKGILRFEENNSDIRIYLIKKYFVNNEIVSKEEKRAIRLSAAQKGNQIITDLEDAIIELIPQVEGSKLSELDYRIWDRLLNQRMKALENTYDFDRTKVYAKRYR